MSIRTSPVLTLLAVLFLVAAGDTKAQSTLQYTQTNLVSDSPNTAEAKTYDLNSGTLANGMTTRGSRALAKCSSRPIA